MFQASNREQQSNGDNKVQAIEILLLQRTGVAITIPFGAPAPEVNVKSIPACDSIELMKHFPPFIPGRI